jgi:hypothetical protein
MDRTLKLTIEPFDWALRQAQGELRTSIVYCILQQFQRANGILEFLTPRRRDAKETIHHEEHEAHEEHF